MRLRAHVAALAAATLLAGAAAAAAAPPRVPRLAHVVVVVLENRERDQVIGGGSPLLTAYAHTYVDLQAYFAVAHPSLPNYLALVSGSTHGITSDCTSCVVRGPTIGTLLDAAHERWAGYAEGYPAAPGFAKKHMPFLYFDADGGHVHPLGDLDPKSLPAFAFVAPNLCHDAHDCGLSSADTFLRGFLPPLLTVPRTAVFVVFDEGTSDAAGGGHVAALVLGTAVRRHATSTQPCTHYCLLRTIEEALGVGHLGASARAKPLTGIWRR